MKTVLQTHAAAYPAMLPQDAVRLVYQSVFGGGPHEELLSVCAERIAAKMTAPCPPRAFEPVGGGKMRVYVSHPEVRVLPPELLAQMVHVTFGEIYGNDALLQSERLRRLFSERKELLRQEAQAGRFSFSLKELDEYLRLYSFRRLYGEEGLPVHHSSIYKETYAPAYIVLDARFRMIWPLLLPLAERMKAAGRFTLVLDGMAAAGKTTAASLLQAVFGGETVHMDDFFLPAELRTEERLREPGGNVHYERFCEEVLAPLRTGTPFSYRVFSCRSMTYTGEKHVDPSGNVLIEGSYALHPQFGALPARKSDALERYPADAAAFLRVAPEEQRERILRRNGAQQLCLFEERWIPMENAYRAAFEARLRPYFLPQQQEV